MNSTTAEAASTTRRWVLHEDRALPADAAVREIAREIHGAVKHLPIVSMHGHVPVEWFADDASFGDPAQLLVTPDHYLMRMLVSQGESLAALGVASSEPVGEPPSPREIWRRFCAGWSLFRGTPTRFWLETELVEIFGVTERPSSENADALFDRIQRVIDDPGFRPRRLLDRFGIEVIATTDPAWSDLAHHRALAAEGYADRIVPTFRPDALLQLERGGWRADLDLLSDASGVEVTSYARFLEALRIQRAAFKAAGARATDHGHTTADTAPLPHAEATRILDTALRGDVDPADAAAFRSHMLFQMAAMSADDHLVMQIHPGVLRDHDRDVAARHGQDKGYDIPVAAEYTRALRPLLEAFGHSPGFRAIVFAIDEDVYSRELAPLAGVYPALRLGAPWWFLDAPDAMRRFREATTETAGFANTSGFVDDTRAFCSIPARHDLARRIDAGYLARLVAEHRLELDEALDTAVDLAYRLPLLSYERR